MKIKYNRFALIPHTCSKCRKTFWLEKYSYSSEFRGMYTLYTILCKECFDDFESDLKKRLEGDTDADNN